MPLSDKKAARFHRHGPNWRQHAFTTIHRHVPIRRAGIVRLTDLTAATVSKVVLELVAEEASRSSAQGKPPESRCGRTRMGSTRRKEVGLRNRSTEIAVPR